MLCTYDFSCLLQDIQQNEHATSKLTNCKIKYTQGMRRRTHLKNQHESKDKSLVSKQTHINLVEFRNNNWEMIKAGLNCLFLLRKRVKYIQCRNIILQTVDGTCEAL
jgi:hypothetical protein